MSWFAMFGAVFGVGGCGWVVGALVKEGGGGRGRGGAYIVVAEERRGRGGWW